MDRDEAPADAYFRFSNVNTPVMVTISSCQWMSIAFEDLGTVWRSENEKKYFGIDMNRKGRYVIIGGIYIRVEFPKDFFIPDKWFFFCFTYNNKEKQLVIFLNSEKIWDTRVQEHLDTFVIEEDVLKHEKFGKAGRFAGQVTDLNIWSRILNSSEIESLYSCEVLDEEPDIVDWESAEIVSGNSITVSEEKTHPCHDHTEHESETMIYDVKVGIEPDRKVLRVCKALGGSMEVPASSTDLEVIKEKFDIPCKLCQIWIPIFKNSEGEWTDTENNAAIYLPWMKGQPNGGKNHERCSGMWLEVLGYYDSVCAQDLRFYCHIKDYQVFQLKGMCTEKGKSVDRKFVMRLENTLNRRPTWRGFSSSSIQWNNEMTRWEMTDTTTEEVIASLSSREFPVGEGMWKLHSRNTCIKPPNNLEQKLMFSNCGQFEYTCSDGTCIPIHKKCDFVPDCFDKGDEKNCQLLHNENLEDYDSNIPDIILDKSGKIQKKNIKISLLIKEIESIEEVKSRFTATFTLKVEWIDARLTWYDLNEDIDLNIPSKEHKRNIWFPKILIANSKDNVEVPNDSQSKIRVRMNGNLTMSSKEIPRESALFNGGENHIIYSRQFSEKLKCAFDLSFFPFDTQTCSISLNAGNEERNLVKLVGDKVEFTGNKKLATFDVLKAELDSENKAGDIDVKVNVILKRQISQHLLGIYLPSLFIMAIAQVIFSI